MKTFIFIKLFWMSCFFWMPQAPLLADDSTDHLKDAAIQSFLAGERVYEPEPEHFTLDQGTVNDLELDQIALRLQDQKPWTPIGLQRFKWLMRNPYLDPEEIRRRQEVIQTLAENEELLDALEKIFFDLYEKMPKIWRDGDTTNTFHFDLTHIHALPYDAIKGRHSVKMGLLEYIKTLFGSLTTIGACLLPGGFSSQVQH